MSHVRIRSTVRWGCTAVTALLIVAWLASGWWYIGYLADFGATYSIDAGLLNIQHMQLFDGFFLAPGWYRSSHAFQICWALERQRLGPGNWFWHIPLWPIPAASLIITAIVWRRDTLALRRARLNLCPRCNYDRTGIAPQAPCPECGNPHPRRR